MQAPYYQDDHVILYHGSCDELLPGIANIDLVFTSPPYNLGTCNGGQSGLHAKSLAAKDLAGGYGTHSDAMPQSDYDEWQKKIVSLCWSALSDTGAIFYNHKPRVQGGIAMLPTQYGEGLPIRQVITWDRGTGMNFSDSFFLPKSEWIVIWAKPLWRLADRKKCELGDVWRVRPEQDTLHPAPFPLALPTLAINATSAQIVLDPFAGSGTTLRAAKDLGRKAIGIEIDEQFCEIAAKRLQQEVLF